MMAVGIHGHWKLPIGYFLINGISATVQTHLVTQAFELLHETGTSAVSLTLDGHQTNLATLRKLGCSTKIDDLKSHFPHPISGEPVHVFIDACHCLKLVRNQFCALQEVVIPEQGSAKWSFVKDLNNYQNRQGITVANPLSDRHINFDQQKMKASTLHLYSQTPLG